ncbi:hypothetical protein FQN60_015207 [Etheostoma spectabile]|uniref:Uncharacterized protein n=1 Tax=Etheostoma spectabile TaxID=54343 RepID=A0A5J5CSR7_9PERO|nr:hypothetical protein FQN60_015207 [Etheostoma spectabile]
MEKGPGREVHTASADGRAHCVAITWHSSSLGMLSRPRPTNPPPPRPPRACLNQSAVAAVFSLFSHLTFKAGHGDARMCHNSIPVRRWSCDRAVS